MGEAGELVQAFHKNRSSVLTAAEGEQSNA
jgi:hypothetical protein